MNYSPESLHNGLMMTGQSASKVYNLYRAEMKTLWIMMKFVKTLCGYLTIGKKSGILYLALGETEC